MLNSSRMDLGPNSSEMDEGQYFPCLEKNDIFTLKVTYIQVYICLFLPKKEIIMKSCYHFIYLGLCFHEQTWHRK